MDVYVTDFAVIQKADASPVTLADQRAEAIVLADLATLTPTFPIVAEERVAAYGAPTFEGHSFWLVDALDGTREFISRGREFTVNIGFIHNGIPVLGIVYAPALDALYVGVVNETGTSHRAEVWRGGAKTVIGCRARPATPTVAGSKTHEVSDNLKFGMIAEGKVDLYPRFSPTSEWDTAAGHALVRAAGGSVHDQTGVELAYNKPNFLNGRFLVEGCA